VIWKILKKYNFPFYFFIFSFDLGKEWVCLFIFHWVYIRTSIVLILERFRMKEVFEKSWVCLKRCFSFAYSRVWRFKSYLLMAHQTSSKGGGEFLSWGFLSCEQVHMWWFIILLISWIWVAQGSSQFLALILILWARSQVANHHLVYLMDWVAQGVVLIPSIVFISCIFVHCFRFWVICKLLKIAFI